MATSVVMPQLGESVTEGTVTRWLKQVGEHVEADEPLLEVSTDKVDTEIPSPASGYLVAISAAEDDVVEVGGMLATIGDSPVTTPAPAAPSDAAASIDLPTGPPLSPDMAPPPMPPPSMPPPTMPPPTMPPPTEAPAAAPAPSGGHGPGSEVRLPELGESVTEGTVTRWLKQVGDDVAVDEPLVEISTDKVDTEIPSPVAGRLVSIAVAEDETVEVGGVLAVVGSADAVASPPTASPAPAAPAPAVTPPPVVEPAAEAVSAPPPPAEVSAVPAAPTPAAPSTPVSATAPAPTSAAESGAGYVTPLVRKLAADHGIDLATVQGTGVGGRIRRQDVMVAAEAAKAPVHGAKAPPTPEPSPLRGTTEKLSRLRRIIAERMVQSLQESAQLTTVIEVDVTRISQLRDQMKDGFRQREGVPLTYLPFFAKAVVEALKAYPVLNASIDMEQGTVTYHDAEHLGVAVDTPRGLLVPVIRDAGELNIAGLARRISDLADRTRTNQVTPDELSGGTFTLTNTGSRGALFDTPIINQPQVGILGTGAVVKRPVVVSVDGADVIAVRSMVYLALTYDHRLVDGADAARFLAAVRTRLEEGAFEGELGP